VNTAPPVPPPPSGWYPDPAHPQLERFWDGTTWTQVVRQAVAQPPKPAPVRPGDPALQLPLSGWWRRFGSGMIDTVIAWIAAIALLLLATPGFLTGFWRDYLAWAYDIQTAMATPGTALPLPTAQLQQEMSSLMLAVGGVTAIYSIVFLGTWGATLGHRACGIKVIKAPLPPALLPADSDKPFTEQKPGWLRAISKGLGWALFSTGGNLFILIQLANALLPLWHKRKQSITDLLANTLVVRTDPH